MSNLQGKISLLVRMSPEPRKKKERCVTSSPPGQVTRSLGHKLQSKNGYTLAGVRQNTAHNAS